MTGPQPNPAVSVVVATHDRATLLPRLVGALEVQGSALPFEVLVVDDASSDDTWRVLQRLAEQTMLRLRPLRLTTNRGPAAARNLGWREAAAPLIAFTDDDCTPQPGWLDALVDALEQADIAQGTTLPDPGQSANAGPFSHTMRVQGENGFYETCNAGYRRDVLEKVGGFDERFRRPYGEDVDLAWRAKEQGATTTFAAAAVVHHDIRPGSVRAHWHHLRRQSGVVVLVASHPGLRPTLHWGLFFRRSHPPAMLAAAGIALLVASRRSRSRMLGLSLLAPYVAYRWRHPLVGTSRSATLLPLSLASDLTELGVLIGASIRERTLVL